MTDQGAWERARAVLSKLSGYAITTAIQADIAAAIIADDVLVDRCLADEAMPSWDVIGSDWAFKQRLAGEIVAVITAAASDAIDEALSAAADELIRLYDRSADRENFIKTSKKRMEIASALATRVQSPSPQTKEPE